MSCFLVVLIVLMVLVSVSALEGRERLSPAEQREIDLRERRSRKTTQKCAKECSDLRYEVLNMEICREAKKVLPRPKVGEYCSNAMEQGFQDVCYALCKEEKPVSLVASACKNAAMEMPRPTVRRWCEHGYSTAYEKTFRDLRSHFLPKAEPVAAAVQEEEPIPAEPAPELLISIPVTIGDKIINLDIFKGQNAEESVAVFCKENMSSTDVADCIDQLLPIAQEKIDSTPAN